MFHREILVGEFFSIDALATGSIAFREVAALAHEPRNDSVEFTAFVAEALLPGTQSTEILYENEKKTTVGVNDMKSSFQL